MKYVQILASTFAFVAAAALLAQMHEQRGQLYLFVVLFLLCGANLLARLTETHIGDQIVEAEEKVAKRVLRRLSKVMPELLDEYFKAQAAKPEEKLSNVIVTTKAVTRESLPRPVGPQPETIREGTESLKPLSSYTPA